VKLGLYGGTFDPIHNAHLRIAQFVKKQLELDKVIFIPASRPPHKEKTSSANLRLKMVKAAIADYSDFDCSTIEIDRKGKSFTFDTITEMKERYKLKKNQLFWIIGSDNLSEFHTWHKPNEILDICTIVVFPRDTNNVESVQNDLLQKVIYLEEAPLLNISATEIRSRISKGQSVENLIPPSVKKIIFEEKLYS